MPRDYALMIRIFLDVVVVVDDEALVMMRFTDYYEREIRPEEFFILRGEDLGRLRRF